jgi:hypothetical protein
VSLFGEEAFFFTRISRLASRPRAAAPSSLDGRYTGNVDKNALVFGLPRHHESQPELARARSRVPRREEPERAQPLGRVRLPPELDGEPRETADKEGT